MPDNATFDSVDLNGGHGDPQQYATWINSASARVAQGLSLDRSGQWDPARGKFGIPPAYAINDGQLVPESGLWEATWKGMLGTAGFAALGMLIGPTLGAAPAAGPLATGETGVAATTAAGTPPAALAATTAATASGAAPWIRTAISAAAPFAIRAATGAGGSNGTGANGLDAEQNDLLTQLIKMSMTRQEESAPIHKAAMALAGNLAPSGSWADSPRFQDAVQQTGGPGPAPIQNPTIAAAYAKLMGGR